MRVVNEGSHQAFLESRKGLHYWSAWTMLAAVSLHTLGGVTLRVDALASSRSASGEAGTNLYQLALILVIALAIATTVLLDKSIRTRNLNGLIVLVFLWCFTSALWSISPVTTVRRSILLLITSYPIFLSVGRLGIDRAVGCVITVCLVVEVIDYLFVATGLGIHTSSELGGVLAGDWRGMHPHKNSAGAFHGALVVFSFLLFTRKPTLRLLVMFAASFAFLIFANSKTAWVAAPLAIAVSVSISLLVRHAGKLFPMVGFLSFATLAIVALQDVDFTLQNESFTGRGEIWFVLIRYIEDNPLLGAGFGAFWNVGFDSPIFGLTNTWVSTLTEGHNGYLDQAVAIGVPGLLLTVVAFYLLPLFRVWKIIEGTDARIWLALILFSLFQNATESALLAPDGPAWFFLVFSVAVLGMPKRSGKFVPVAAQKSMELGLRHPLKSNV